MEREFFVAHELNVGQNDDLRNTIKRAFAGTGLRAKYIEKDPENILDNIKKAIYSTEFGIYDFGSKKEGITINYNVLLEFGIAKGANKPCYPIIKGIKSREILLKNVSDLAGTNIIAYETQKELEEYLRKEIRSKYYSSIPEELKTFWSPFIEKGGTIILGTQRQILEKDAVRFVIGEYDNLAVNELLPFLYSAAKSSVVKTQGIKLEYLTNARTFSYC